MRARARRALRALLVAALAAACGGAEPNQLTVAVAANFKDTCQVLAERFEAESGARAVLVSGSTGSLSAQIANGAPFDVFLAADDVRPAVLAEHGLALAETRFPYALGRLALCGRGVADGADGRALLAAGGFRALAIANPETAPYGAAARQVLERLGLLQGLAGRLVVGESVAQAFHFAASGGAELAFVALAQWQALAPDERAGMGAWIVPAELHEPIRQDAILLRHGAANPHARAFLALLRREETRALLVRAGYETVSD